MPVSFGSLAPTRDDLDELQSRYIDPGTGVPVGGTDRYQPPKEWAVTPDLLGTQLGQMPAGTVRAPNPYPPGSEEADWFDRQPSPAVSATTGKPVPVIERPSVLPFVRTPEGIKYVKSKAMDLATYLLGDAAAPESALSTGVIAARKPASIGASAVGNAPADVPPTPAPVQTPPSEAPSTAQTPSTAPAGWNRATSLPDRPAPPPSMLHRIHEALSITPSGVARTATGLAPGAGIADVMGYLPDYEGGTSPSFGQNVRAGRYGQAALQTVGAAGDIAYAMGAVPLGLAAHEIATAGKAGKVGAEAVEEAAGAAKAVKAPKAPKVAPEPTPPPPPIDQPSAYEHGPLTPEEHALTVNDILHPDTPAEPPRSKTVEDIAAGLQQRGQSALQDMGFDPRNETPSPEHNEVMARAMASEIKNAMDRGGETATDWYRGKVEEAMRTAQEIHPELEDPHQRMAYTLGLAVTSQGEKVRPNVRLADQVYQTYKDTGRFPIDFKGSKQAPAMNANFGKLNKLLDDVGPQGLHDFLHKDFTVRELKQAGYDVGSSELMDTKVKGSTILGSKIGGGFFQNLSGNFDPVTMDLWFMRGWGRLAGTLVGNPEAMPKATARLQAALQAEGKAVPQTEAELAQAADAARLAHERDFRVNRAQYNSGEKEKSELANASIAWLKNYRGINEQPKSGGHREWIRGVVNRARDILEQEHGVKMSNADLQATWWYPEKELYAKLGGKLPAEDVNVDYATALRELRDEKRAGAATAAAEPAAAAAAGAGAVPPVENGRVGRSGNAANVPAGVGGGGAPGGGPAPAEQAARFGSLAPYGTTGNTAPAATAEISAAPVRAGAEVRATGQGNVGGLPANERGGSPPAALGGGRIKFTEAPPNSGAAFAQAISEAKAANPFGSAVHVYDPSEYDKMRTFLTEDGKAGFALKGNDIVSVFRHPDATHLKGAADEALKHAVAEGGQKLDAFDTRLPHIYGKNGFKAVGRLPFNDEFRPEGWNYEENKPYNNGRPDVVFMVHDPTAGPYKAGDGQMFDDYDKAVAAQDKAVAAIASRKTPLPKIRTASKKPAPGFGSLAPKKGSK